MARQYILLKPDDGALWRLAQAIATAPPTDPPDFRHDPLDFAGLVQTLCAKEAGLAEVNIAQMSEILRVLRELLAADPKPVLEVLTGEIRAL
ncbi:MAG: hypothetical protein IMZ66_08920 [Planctomycetes bacterium]|nr:hypothetical protein [Planctomycetota bacterium]